MSDKIRMRVDVRDGQIADKLREAIERGVKKGAGATSQDGIGDQMEEAAQFKLRTENKIWTGELISSFKTQYSPTGGSLTITFENTADHAAPIEYGADYGSRGPPLIPIAAWIMTGGADYAPPSDGPDEETLRNRLESEELLDSEGEEIDPLDEFPRHVIDQAFNVQEHIRRHGIDAVHFMDTAEQWVEENGADTLAQAIRQEVDKI